MSEGEVVFNPPPGWPSPPPGWRPPAGWTPDPSWPEPPTGWQLWLPAGESPDGLAPNSNAAPPRAANASSSASDHQLAARVAVLEAETGALREQVANSHIGDELVVLDDERILQEVGIYRYHHPLENATLYRAALDDLSARIAEAVKAGQAIETSNLFTLDNSLAKGRRMTDDLSKLMLRAYNAEADNAVRSLRAGNVVTAKKRLEASRAAIAKLGRMMEMHISESFHALRLEEIELTADWLMKKQEEKEAAREERARLREERRVAKELAEERQRLDKERAHLLNALKALEDSGQDDPGLRAKLEVLDDAIAKNDFRAANIRAGYVYVISNRGAFGSNVVKIGLTRRLEPLDRVNELSGAAVPFPFDVHALFFSEDAVALEADLHQHFAGRAVNLANPRKEFFFASPSDVRAVLADKVGSLLEFAEHVEATQYLQSVRYWPNPRHSPGPRSDA